MCCPFGEAVLGPRQLGRTPGMLGICPLWSICSLSRHIFLPVGGGDPLFKRMFIHVLL